MSQSLEDKFNSACDHLPALVKNLDKSILLQFYAYYKQASIGECNIDKPSWFNMEAKSKYNAWVSLGKMSKEDAMLKYIELLSELDPDWENQPEQEIDWDDESNESRNEEEESNTKGWVNVSSMINNESDLADEDKNIYDWVKEGNLNMLIKVFSSNKELNVNQLDENGLNCLHWACDRAQVDIVKYLIDTCGADVNVPDSEGDTALDYASIIGNNELRTYLKEKGAYSQS